MQKQAVRVKIGRAVQKTAPGMPGRKFDFTPGHTFLTQEWYSPGEPYAHGILAGKPRDAWYFVANAGTDLPLTFDVEDVSEVIIFDDPETVKVFKGAPFQVFRQPTHT